MIDQDARIGIVSVCFHSMAVLSRMLGSLPAGTPVALVDNAGDTPDTNLTALAQQYGATLITNSRNRGFGAACNQGAAALDTEFILFLNPDAALSTGTLDALLAAADRHPEASAFNPRIGSEKGHAQFKRGSILLPRAEWMPRGWPDTDTQVPVLFGAALMVRRSAFEAIGGFDEAIFLYHEDDDLSLRLKTRGALMFVQAGEVTHLAGRSSARSPEVARLKAWHLARSRIYTSRKHGRPAPFLRTLASALLQLFSPAMLSARKRAKQIAYLRGTLSTLRDGGRHQQAAPDKV